MQPQPLTPPNDGGAAAAEDLHLLALRREDEVVQQLAVAKYALTIADMERAMAAIDAALVMARRSLTQLLGVVGTTPGPSTPIHPARLAAPRPIEPWPALAAPRPRLPADDIDQEPVVTAARSSRAEAPSGDAASSVEPPPD